MFVVSWKCLHSFLNEIQYRCWSEYGLLRWRPRGCFLAWDVLSYSQYISILLRIMFFLVCFNNLIWFLRSSICLSLLVDVCFVVEGTLAGDFPRWCCVWTPAFSRELEVFLGCLFCLFFSNVELMDRWCWCFPYRHLHKTSWSLLKLLLTFALLLVRVDILDSWTFWISVVAADVL